MEDTQQIPVCKKCGGPRDESGPPDFCIPCSQAPGTPVESTVSEVAESVCADPAPAAHEQEPAHDDIPRKVKSEAEWEDEEVRLIEEEWTEKEHDCMSSVRASQSESQAADTVEALQELVSTVPTAPADDLPALDRGFPSPGMPSPRFPRGDAHVPESPVYAPASPAFYPGQPQPQSQSHLPVSPSYAPASPVRASQQPTYSHGRSPYVPPIAQVPESPPPGCQATQAEEVAALAPAPPPKQPGKVRMTPACATCKRSKIRCVHRRVIDNGNPVAPAPAPAVPPKKRKRADDTPSPGATQGTTDAAADAAAPPPTKRVLRLRAPRKPAGEDKPAPQVQAAAPAPAPEQAGKRPRGRPRKRKAVTFEEGVDGSEEDAPPAKRGRMEQDLVQDQCQYQGQVQDDEVAGASVSAPAQRGVAADSVEGASVLAMHRVLSRELGEKLEACQTSLQATIDSIHDARELLDAWVEAWTRKK